MPARGPTRKRNFSPGRAQISPDNSRHLESRCAPAFTATLAGTVLSLVGDAASDNLTLSDAESDGFVDLNGTNIAGTQAPQTLPIIV